MAMDANVLGADMKQRILAAFGIQAGGFNDEDFTTVCNAISEAVVSHITTQAVVTVEVTGVQNGGGTAPGMGTVA